MLFISGVMAQFIGCPSSSGANDDLVVVVPHLYLLLLYFYLYIIVLNTSKVTTRGVVNASRLNCKFFWFLYVDVQFFIIQLRIGMLDYGCLNAGRRRYKRWRMV